MVMLPNIADERDGVDVRHLISDADAGSWDFALTSGEWLTSDDGLTVCNRAFWSARNPHSTANTAGEEPDHVAR